MNELCIIAYFKNESHILEEWINHHLEEGVDHFYLINNDSNDGFLPILQPFINKNIVTLYNKPERYCQIKHLTEVFHEVKNINKWCMIIDLDEFVFAPKFNNLKEYLSDKAKYGGVGANWTLFASRDEYEQPKSVIDGFLWRSNKIVPDGTKVIIQSNVIQLRVVDEKVCPLPQVELHAHHYIDPNILIDNENLKVFHYQIQSKEYFDKVKRVRGDACDPSQNSLRGDEYFYSRDIRDKEDTTLRDRRLKRYAS